LLVTLAKDHFSIYFDFDKTSACFRAHNERSILVRNKFIISNFYTQFVTRSISSSTLSTSRNQLITSLTKIATFNIDKIRTLTLSCLRVLLPSIVSVTDCTCSFCVHICNWFVTFIAGISTSAITAVFYFLITSLANVLLVISIKTWKTINTFYWRAWFAIIWCCWTINACSIFKTESICTFGANWWSWTTWFINLACYATCLTIDITVLTLTIAINHERPLASFTGCMVSGTI